MKFLIAPDSFKECLSAPAVAEAIAAGVRDADPTALVDLCPMADGGQGTVEAMVAATGGQFREVDTFDALLRPVRARFGVLDGDTAVIEMAAAAGLELIEPASRNPLKTSSFGVGKLMLAALGAGARKLVIGIGGSATVDGGAGCAQALGVSFLGADGKLLLCGLAGGDLHRISRIILDERDGRIAAAAILVACDVTNPLTGALGAAAVFGPQKGATPEMVRQLDAGLAHLAGLLQRDLHVAVDEVAGAGAAGGLGAGLVAFCGAKLRRGVEIVAGAVGLARRAAAADVVITGEGRLDSQSAHGKTAFGVAQIAAAAGKPVICIPGQATADAPRAAFALVKPLVAGEVDVAAAMAEPARWLRLRAREAIEQRGWQ